MGQSSSTEKIPEFQVELLKHVRSFSEIAGITYEDFKKNIDKLNLLSRNYIDNNNQILIFAIKKGSDSSILWKATVRIACIKKNVNTQNLVYDRFLNLAEFLQICKSVQCQININEESQSSCSNAIISSQKLNHINYSHFSELANLGDNPNECCICFERKPELTLPCTHSYCSPCINQWHDSNNTCPICREKLNSTDDAWELTEMPDMQELNQELHLSLIKMSEEKKT